MLIFKILEKNDKLNQIKKPSQSKDYEGHTYSRRDLNPHGQNAHRILSPACLPIPPLERLKNLLSEKRDSNSRPQPWQGCALPTELFSQ